MVNNNMKTGNVVAIAIEKDDGHYLVEFTGTQFNYYLTYRRIEM